MNSKVVFRTQGRKRIELERNKAISFTYSNKKFPRSLKHQKPSSKQIPALQDFHNILGAVIQPDEKEIELEQLVFGCNPDDLEKEEIFLDEEVPSKRKKKSVEKSAAWKDEDDETLFVDDRVKSLNESPHGISLRGDEKYSNYAQESFIKLMGNPKWAEQDSDSKDSDDESEDELLQKTGNFIKPSESLPRGEIKILKTPSLMDSNWKYYEQSIIKSVEFHPTSQVVFTASTNGTGNLFQIDGQNNEKIQSIHFENFPVAKAHFTVDGTEVVVGSNKFTHFFSYDMLAGKISKIPWNKGMNLQNSGRFLMSPDGKYIVIHGRYGNIHLMSSTSKEWIGSLKMNGEVISITFNRDGTKMYSHGDTGEIYVWDMSSRKCIHKFIDEGCIAGTALAVSPNDQFLATGSDSGVVNIYDNATLCSTSSPQPKKVLLNLTTDITHLKFNHTSEILAMASSYKEEAFKLVHFPSFTVFSNFPAQFVHRYPSSSDISPNSGYMSIGNNVGTTFVYRLKHYGNY